MNTDLTPSLGPSPWGSILAIALAAAAASSAVAQATPASAPATVSGGSRQASPAPVTEIRSAEGGFLYQTGPQRVLVLAGDGYSMGRQQGLLLADEVRRVLEGTLAWTARMGTDAEGLDSIWTEASPHVPPRILAEMRGLAEAAEVPLQWVHRVHAMPSRYHCSGVVAAGVATKNGALVHSRSLDYALDIGGQGPEADRIQNHALLIIRRPTDGVPNAVPAWAGFLGAVTGMNGAGITIGEMGSVSRDETYAGLPMIFTLREALRRGVDLQGAVDTFQRGPRTCGFNYLVGSGDAGDGVALEVTAGLFKSFSLGRMPAASAPHRGLPGVQIRSNHFLDPETAATQRQNYNPAEEKESSWTLWSQLTEFIGEHHGAIDTSTLVESLRSYPAGHPCLHQAVMAGTSRKMLVAQAVDDRHAAFPGAQNQPFVEHDVGAWFAGKIPSEVTVHGRAPASTELQALQPTGAGLTRMGGAVRARTSETTSKGRIVQWTNDQEAASLLAELHLPDRPDSNRRPLVVIGTGDPRTRIPRAMADAMSALGIPTAVIPIPAVDDPKLQKAVFHRVRSTMVGLRSTPVFKDSAVFGIGFGAPTAFSIADEDTPLFVAFTGEHIAKAANEDDTIARMARFFGVEPFAIQCMLAVSGAEAADWMIDTNRPRAKRTPDRFFGLRDEQSLSEESQEDFVELLYGEDPNSDQVRWFQGGFKALVLHLPGLATTLRDALRRDG